MAKEFRKDKRTEKRAFKPREFNSPKENYRSSKDKLEERSTEKQGRKTFSKEFAPSIGRRAFKSRPSRNKVDNKPTRFVRNDSFPPPSPREGRGEGQEKFKSPFKRKPLKPFIKKDFSHKPFNKKFVSPSTDTKSGSDRLNKYIANTGVCSRREADELIAAGVVSVNGKVITEMGYKVSHTDIVNYGGQTLRREKSVYILLNKPKDYITTVEDPQGRKTVLTLISNACRERVYPVGRLDRATTGVLLFTNDGELTKRLTHPRYGIKKIYHVVLDKPLKKSDFDKIVAGFELEDGPIKVDEISYVGEGTDKKEIGVEIHSGKNRIVRRIFEHFGYNVRKLDRVSFAGLTKKDLPRGRWRMLTEKDLQMLNMVPQ